MSYYSQTDLSTQNMGRLIGLFKFPTESITAEMAESAIIRKMDNESLRNKVDSVEIVLGTEGLSNKIMIRALELYSNQMNFLNMALTVIHKENSDEVKKKALYMLAGKAYLHTLEEMQQKRIFNGNRSLETILGYSIKKAIAACMSKGHFATLGHSLGYRKLRLATCSG